jgi:hypothetical protein
VNDRDFLIWLHERLTEVYGEKPTMDYMYKLRAIIKTTPADQLTPNLSDVGDSKENSNLLVS